MFILMGGALNFVAACVVLWVSLRNCKIHAENLSLTDKIGKAMTMMKELRDMLDADLHDPFSPGNVREKEVRH